MLGKKTADGPGQAGLLCLISRSVRKAIIKLFPGWDSYPSKGYAYLHIADDSF